MTSRMNAGRWAWRVSGREWRRSCPTLASFPAVWKALYLAYVAFVLWHSIERRAWAQAHKPSAVIGSSSLAAFVLMTALGLLLPVALFLMLGLSSRSHRAAKRKRASAML